MVEHQYSLEVLIAILGDTRLADRVEHMTFNALPAAFAPDVWSHQYVRQVNQIRCTILADNIYTNNRADANTFGLEPNYGCCAANMHQGGQNLPSTSGCARRTIDWSLYHTLPAS